MGIDWSKVKGRQRRVKTPLDGNVEIYGKCESKDCKHGMYLPETGMCRMHSTHSKIIAKLKEAINGRQKKAIQMYNL